MKASTYILPIFITLFASILQNSLSAQEFIDPALQHSFNKNINYSLSLQGLHEGAQGEADLLYRYQWVGLEGAPKSIWFNAVMPLQKIAATAGINVRQFTIAVEKSQEINAHFNKSIRISDQDYLGLGLNVGWLQKQGDYAGLDPLDPAFKDNLRESSMTYGMSTSLISPERYYVGISIPRFIAANDDSDYVRQFGKGKLVYVTSAFVFALGEEFYLKPTVLGTYREYTGLQVDASVMAFFTKKLGLGLGFRQRGDFTAAAEFNLHKFRFAYSFQKSLKNKDLNRYIANNTHELGVALRFGNQGFSIL